MKLRNKKTGEIGTLIVDGAYKFVTNFAVEDDEMNRLGEYNSLAELNEEWEDYKEPREYWCISQCGDIVQRRKLIPIHDEDMEAEHKEIGNYFETKEEAEKAREKLKAWKRLKDKGFRFDGWEDLQAEMDIDDLMLFNRDVLNTDNVIGFRMDDYHDCIKDLNTCFGGEE